MIKTKKRKIIKTKYNYRLILSPFWWGVLGDKQAHLSIIDSGYLLTAEPTENSSVIALSPYSNNQRQICLPKSDSLNVETTLDTDEKEIKIIYK